MTAFQAVHFSPTSGQPKRVAATDSLIIGTGAESASGQSLSFTSSLGAFSVVATTLTMGSVGATANYRGSDVTIGDNASAVKIGGTSGTATLTLQGNATVTGNLTVTGTEIVSSTVNLNQDVILGDAANDTISMKGSWGSVADPDFNLRRGSAHSFVGRAAGSSDGSTGDAISYKGSAGGNGAAGASPTHGGIGGALALTGAKGGTGQGSSTSGQQANGGAGGTLTIKGGDGGDGTTGAMFNGAAGNAGALVLLGGDGGANGNGNGSNVDIAGGALTGSGTNGLVRIGFQTTSSMEFGNVTTNPTIVIRGTGTITQLSTGQVTFNGNVDTTAGLDVTGGSGLSIDGIGIDSSGSALLLGTGTTAAPRVPQLTTAQRDALTAQNGMIIYNTTTAQFEGYDVSWQALGSGGAVAGTDSETFTINQDAAAADSQDVSLITKAGRGAGGTTKQAWRLLHDHDSHGAAGSYQGQLLIQSSTDHDGGVYTTRITIAPGAATPTITLGINVDATAGLDVSGGDFTSTGGQIVFNGTNVDLNPTGDYTLDLAATKKATITIADNLASAWLVREGTNNYIDVSTTDAGPEIKLGNTTVNPKLTKVGNGLVDMRGTGGSLDVPAGTSFLIGGVAVGTANFTAANVTALLDGTTIEDFGTALHKHEIVQGNTPQTKLTGQTEAAGSAFANNMAGRITRAGEWNKTDAQIDAGSRFAGIRTASGEFVLSGVVTAAFTTDGGSPAEGAPIYLARAAADANAGAGKLTAGVNNTNGEFNQEVGICLDNANYAGSKTCVIVLQPKVRVDL